jgi:hypothetical protein
VQCHGVDPEPFSSPVRHPETPGDYYFPPLASLITSGARLMLALLEHSVSDAGGTYAMEDTDSMAIVANEHGGLVACPGGPHRMADGQEAVCALSWEQVRNISARFKALNPYAADAIPSSILKIEDDNFDPTTKRQRPLYCFAISAKRYALFIYDSHGSPVLLRDKVNSAADRWSEHGLGHLRNPTDPESDDSAWIAHVWLAVIRRALHLPARALRFGHRPAIGRITVSSPGLLTPFAALNDGKPYVQQVKPFNFGVTCFVRAFGHPPGADPTQFHLYGPYETDSRRWTKMDWIEQYSGSRYRITTEGEHGSRRLVRVKSYGEVLQEYEFHPESKCADSEGLPCSKQTIGLLQRRHVRTRGITYIGKESNRLEEVESGLIHAADGVYTEYVDPRREEWRRAAMALSLKQWERASGKSRRILIDARRGRRRPHRTHRELLVSIARRLRVL